MAAVGAGTTGFYTGSHIFKKPQLARSSRHKYKAVFSPTALKQTLNEQKIHEYEYLTMRRRAFWKRHQLEETDPCKRRASLIQPWGLVVVFIGLLVCCCAFLKEWSRTFPLGDIRGLMDTLKPVGVGILVIGLAITSFSHLYYYKNETGSVRNPLITFKPITLQQARIRQPKLTITERIYACAQTIFRLAGVGIVTCFLLFCTGRLAEWGQVFPAGISGATRRAVGTVGIYGAIVSVVAMIATDMIVTWIEENKFIRNKTKRKSLATLELSPFRSSLEVNSIEDEPYDRKEKVVAFAKFNAVSPMDTSIAPAEHLAYRTQGCDNQTLNTSRIDDL